MRIEDNPVYKELQAKLQAEAAKFLYSPVQDSAAQAESIRAITEEQYRMMYAAGLIDSMPAVSIASYDPRNGDVQLNVTFPVTRFEAILKYAVDDTENSAIDSPPEKP